MFKLFLIAALIFLPLQTFAQVVTPESSHVLLFQIIQDEFVLDTSTVKKAQLIETDGVYNGLNVQLKPKAAAVFTDMTKAGIGRRINLVFNKVIITNAVIQSSLGDSFLIAGISKQDAQAFLNILNADKAKNEDKEATE